MKKRFQSKKQLLFVPLSLALVTASCPFVTFAEQSQIYSDIQEHWAADEIVKWSHYGVLQGFDGKFNPDASITRGEMAVVLNKIMNYQKTSENLFDDVDSAFYTDPILKVYAAGVMSGSDNKMRPKDLITQQEAIALLARAFEIEKSDAPMAGAEMADWAKGDIYGMNAIGALEGISFQAETPITRAEAVKIIDNMVGQFYNVQGEYSENAEDFIVINTPDVLLKDCSVKGDVILSEGIGDGDVTLQNVEISGRLLVHGGGVNTVKLNGCTINSVFVDKQTGNVRILSENNTKITNTIVDSETLLEGNFENVSITGSSEINLKGEVKKLSAENSAYILVESGKINEVSLNMENARLRVNSNASIDSLNIVKKADIEIKGTIQDVKIEKGAESTILNGNGQISQVVSHANNVAVNVTNTTIKLGEGVENVVQNGNKVTTGVSDTTPKKSSGGGGGGGGSSNTQTSYSIHAIESISNSKIKITLNQKTGQVLNKNAVGIFRMSDGKEMAVSGITTADNKIYEITTGNYEDGNYRLELTIDNKKITKEFSVKKEEIPQIPFQIEKVEAIQNNLVKVTLNQKTGQVLNKNAVGIFRISDGKEMTVSGITTANNKIYEITTGNYEDGNYRLELTIDNKKITKEFSVKKEEIPQIPFQIEKVESVQNGLVKVTLNQKTEKELDKNAFSIICTGGGRDMTILNVTTQDNQVYQLTTAYYDDNTYNLEITLPDGTRIDKDFETKFDCAQIEIAGLTRTTDTTASLNYISDAPGFFYYLLQPKQEVRAISNQEPTAEEVIQNGIKTEMKVHSNTITISDLAKNVGYDLYYTAVDADNRITPVKNASIGSEPVQVPDQGDISIQSVKVFKEDTNDAYVIVYGFEIVLSAPTEQKLEFSSFDASCPRGPATLGEVRSTDNQTYKLYFKKGVIPYNGGNTYQIEVTLLDGNVITGSTYMDVQAPLLNFYGFEWKDENTVIATVKSDEAGTLYYSILDEVEGADTTKPKNPKPIYENGTKISIGYGENRILLEGVQAEKWFCYAPEDEFGNRTLFFSYKQIPAYVPPAPEEPDGVKISNVEVISATGQPKLKVTLNQSVNILAIDNRYTQISGFSGKLLTGSSLENGKTEGSVFYITILNFNEISPGSHDLTLYINDKKVVSTFSVGQREADIELKGTMDITEEIPATEVFSIPEKLEEAEMDDPEIEPEKTEKMNKEIEDESEEEIETGNVMKELE